MGFRAHAAKYREMNRVFQKPREHTVGRSAARHSSDTASRLIRAMRAWDSPACGQEFRYRYPSLRENGAEGSLRDVAGVVGDRCVSLGSGVVPNLMASGRLPIKVKPEVPQPSDDITIAVACKRPHQSLTTSG